MDDREQEPKPAEWRYATASDLDKPPIERLRQFPRELDYSVMTLRLLGSIFLRGYLTLVHRYRVAGRENLPAGDSSYVVVANHSSHFDALCLHAALPWRRIHRTYPAAAKDYFFEKLPHTIVAGVFINAIPFDRLHDSEGSLDLCRQVLAGKGNCLILFPEGTRAQDGRLTRFRTGIGRLVAGSGIPVVPCYLEPPWRAFPKGALLPRPVKLTATFGGARTFEHCTADKAGFIQVANTLHADVAVLAGSGRSVSPE